MYIFVLTGGDDHGNCSLQKLFNGVYASFRGWRDFFKGESPMVKPGWGIKRHCQACGVNFYDLKRSPIICPKCDAEFDPEASVKPRRSRVTTEKVTAVTAKNDATAPPSEKDNKTGDTAAAKNVDDNLTIDALDGEDEKEVFDPAEELEAEPDFEPDAEEEGAEAPGEKDKKEGKEEAGVRAEAKLPREESPGKKPKETKTKAKGASAPKKDKKDKPAKKPPAKPKATPKKKAEPKKKVPAKEKPAKAKEAKSKATKGKS